MKRGLSNIKLIGVYIATAFMFIALGIVFLLMNEKVDLHLSINELHNSMADQFFKYMTYVGDGGVTAIAVLPIGLILFKKYRYSTFVLGWSTLIFTGIFAQFMKRIVYPQAERPIKFITEHVLYTVPGVDLHEMNSFPSGHTATAFAFFAFVSMAFFKGNRMMQFLMAILAVLVGYSRMYLSQHFLEDVVTGAFVGVLAYLCGHILTSMIFKKGIIS